MTSVIIDNGDTNIIQKFLEMGRKKYHLSIQVISDVQAQNIESKSKWAKIADEIRGTLTEDDTKYLQQCSQEMREGFALRDLSVSK
jgi:hypothetical protein